MQSEWDGEEDFQLMPLKKVVEFLGISMSTATRRIRDGRFPKPISWGRNIKLWRLEDVKAYKAKNPVKYRRERKKSDLETIRAMLEKRGAL